MTFIKELKRHFIEIQKKGFKEFIRKFKWLSFEFLSLFISIFFAPIIFLIMILISKFFIFRFGIIRSSRVGHFIANTELYLIEKKLQNKKFPLIVDLLSFDGPISNKYIAYHYKKYLKSIQKF